MVERDLQTRLELCKIRRRAQLCLDILDRSKFKKLEPLEVQTFTYFRFMLKLAKAGALTQLTGVIAGNKLVDCLPIMDSLIAGGNLSKTEIENLRDFFRRSLHFFKSEYHLTRLTHFSGSRLPPG